jgi:hypothetical protein
MSSYTDQEAAEALTQVIGSTTWVGVTLAHAFLATLAGTSVEDAGRQMYNQGRLTLRQSRELLGRAIADGFLATLPRRERTGYAENPVTKLFPAAITEQRFLEHLDTLVSARPTVTYSDDREGASLTDFTLSEGDLRLPINIKNAGTRFNQAAALVGLDPDDCIPIPAYKAHAAIEVHPNLLYAVSVDYGLIGVLNTQLPKLLSREEAITWELLNQCGGSHVRKAEDAFVADVVRKHWTALKSAIADTPFHVVSARKSVRILQTKPQRTPGIGLKAWGTGASGEINVHVSIREDTTPWETVSRRIVDSGVQNIVDAVNRKRTEVVYDPEI